MLHLRKANRRDLAEISRWELSPTDLLYWANLSSGAGVLLAKLEEWCSDHDSSAYVLESELGVVCYGEIWSDVDEIELARLIVRPEARSKGFGLSLTQKLLEVARSQCSSIWVRVHPQNVLALRCYAHVGFRAASVQEQETFNKLQPVQYVWMKSV